MGLDNSRWSSCRLDIRKEAVMYRDKPTQTGWYTPYQQDRDWIAYKRKHRSGATMKVGMILLWFILIVLFA